MSTLKVTNIQDTSGGNSSTTAEIKNGIAKAWVNFNGTGTVAIRASFNVSSITDNGTGKYTINFTNALVDANYVANGSGGSGSGGAADTVIEEAYGADYSKTTIAYKIYSVAANFTVADRENIYVAIFR